MKFSLTYFVGVNLGLAFRNQFYSLMKKENDLDKVIDKWIASI